MIVSRSMCLQIMAERTAELFAKCFGRPARFVVAAPGRVNLIGEHTDYNEGFVLPMAVERYTVMAGDKNTRKEVTLHSMTTGDTAAFPPQRRGPTRESCMVQLRSGSYRRI